MVTDGVVLLLLLLLLVMGLVVVLVVAIIVIIPVIPAWRRHRFRFDLHRERRGRLCRWRGCTVRDGQVGKATGNRREKR